MESTCPDPRDKCQPRPIPTKESNASFPALHQLKIQCAGSSFKLYAFGGALMSLIRSSLACLAGIATLSFVVPSKADLGGADVVGGDSDINKTYDAWCGDKRVGCKVTFSDQRLIVDDGEGITPDQFLSVKKTRSCRQKSAIMPWVKSCFYEQQDKDFKISYTGSNGERRGAVIVFKHEDTANDFERDLELWSGGMLRPLGPSIEIED